MANEEHVAILREEVEVWNRWLRENPSIIPNLRDANLVRVDLTKGDFILADLAGANLTNISTKLFSGRRSHAATGDEGKG
jgi:uncharacterized protein YjbI with pentapeptide repeats